MSELYATAFRLNATDLQIIDEARRRYGLANRTEALRFLLRLWSGKVAMNRDAARRNRRSR